MFHSRRRVPLWYPVSPIMDFLTVLPALCTPADLHPVYRIMPVLCQDLHVLLPPGSFLFHLLITLSIGCFAGSVDFCWDLSCHSSLSTLLSSCFSVLIPVNTVSASRAVPSRDLHRSSVPVALSTATQVVNRCLE